MNTTTETAEKLYTAEDLLGMHKSYELVRGELRGGPDKAMPNNVEHGRIAFRLAGILGEYLNRTGLGIGLVEAGFVLARNPDTVRGPDLAVTLKEGSSAQATSKRGFIPGAPDLAVEIHSPSNSAVEMIEKVAEYLAAGTRLVWAVYPGRKTVIIHPFDGRPRLLRGEEVLDGGDVLPGFLLPLAELFR